MLGEYISRRLSTRCRANSKRNNTMNFDQEERNILVSCPLYGLSRKKKKKKKKEKNENRLRVSVLSMPQWSYEMAL